MSTRNRAPGIPRTRTWGVGLAAVTAVISGFAVFLNGYGVQAWADAGGSSTYTTAKNLVAAAVLLLVAGALTLRRSPEGMTRPANRRQWLTLATIGVVGGSVPFLLFFEGLSRASSVDAAFIHKTLVVWVALLAVPLLGERLGPVHFGAIGLLVWGQAVLAGGLSEMAWGVGESMILAATLLWAVEVVLAKRILSDVSSLTVGVARMGLGVVVLIAYGVFTGGFAELGALGIDQLQWAVLTGVILAGYVGTWYLALARAPAVDVTAVLVGGALITALLRTGVQGAAAPPVLGAALLLAGCILAGWATVRRATPSEA